MLLEEKHCVATRLPFTFLALQECHFSFCLNTGGLGEVADGAAVEAGGSTVEISGSLQAAFNPSDKLCSMSLQVRAEKV